ncbi:uncharacterized protein ank2a [Salminus brasiliensis]|uniref:uncharacterized protein ank2a n=1 Tax=Salminus brasiliensis TaxID=930266 RepID=UPI003B8365E9
MMKKLTSAEIQRQAQTQLKATHLQEAEEAERHRYGGTMKELSITEIQREPGAEPEGTYVQKTEEDDQYGYGGTMEELVSTEPQTEPEGTYLHKTEVDDQGGDGGTMEELSPVDIQREPQTEPEGTYLQKTEEGGYGYSGRVEELSPVEIQREPQTEPEGTYVQKREGDDQYGFGGTAEELISTEPEGIYLHRKVEDDQYGDGGTMQELSITEIQREPQTEPEGTYLQKTEEDGYGFGGTMEELVSTEPQTEPERTYLHKLEEDDQYGYSGTMDELSPVEIQREPQTEPERTYLQKTEEDDQYGYGGTMEKLVSTEPQTEPEGTYLHRKVEDDQYGDGGTVEELVSTEPQTEPEGTYLHRKVEDDQYGDGGTMQKLSITEIQREPQTEPEGTYLQKIEEGGYGYSGRVEELVSTEPQTEPEGTYLHKLEEDDQGGDGGTMEELSPVDIQREPQTEPEGTYVQKREGDDQYGFGGTVEELISTEPQTEPEGIYLHRKMEDDQYGDGGTMQELSNTEIQREPQTEPEGTYLQKTEEDGYGFGGTMEELVSTEPQTEPERTYLHKLEEDDQYGYSGTMDELVSTEPQTESERTYVQKTEEDDQYGYGGTMEKLVSTEPQTEPEGTYLHRKVEDDQYGDGGKMKELSITEIQREPQTEPEGTYLQKIEEGAYGYSGQVEELSPVEIQREPETEPGRTYVQKTEEDGYGFGGTMEELVSTEPQIEPEGTYLHKTEVDDQGGDGGTMKELSIAEIQREPEAESERTYVQKTEEDDQYGYGGRVEELSITEIQTEPEGTYLHRKVEDDQYGDGGTVEELSPAEAEPEGTYVQKTEEDRYGYGGTAEELSTTEVLEHVHIQGIRFEVTEGDVSVQGMEDSLQVSAAEESNHTSEVPEETAESEEFQERQQEPYHQISSTRPANLDAVQPITMSDPKSAYQSDSLETTPVREGFSSHKSPDSIDPSPTKDFSCPDSLETSPTDQRPVTSSPAELHHSGIPIPDPAEIIELNSDETVRSETDIADHFSSSDSQCLSKPLQPYLGPLDVDSREEALRSSSDVQGQFTPEDQMVQIPGSDAVEEDAKIRKEKIDPSRVEEVWVEDSGADEAIVPTEASISSYETADALEGDEEEDEDLDSTIRKQFTPEEEMFKMAAKIRVFDEIEKDSKTRKVRFDFTASSQDREEELRDERSPDHEAKPAKDTTEEYPLQSSPREVDGQAIYDKGTSEYVEYGASEEDEPQIEVSPMQIHIEKTGLHAEFSPQCLFTSVVEGITADPTGEKIPPTSADSKMDTESGADSQCLVIDEKISDESDGESSLEKPPSLPVHPKTDAEEPLEEQKPDPCDGQEEDAPVQGDLVPWSAELEDDESFDSRIEAEERKVFALVEDSESHGTTPESTPGRTPTEERTPNPFLFQEGKLFEMTRGGAIDMSRRSLEEEQDAFAFFPLREDPAEEALTGEVEECGTVSSTHESSLVTPLDSTTAVSQDEESKNSGPVMVAPAEGVDRPIGSGSYAGQMDSESVGEKDLDSVDSGDSSIANIDTATSTVTRSVYSEQDVESSDSSTEEEQHSVIEIPTPTQDTAMLPSVSEPHADEDKLQSSSRASGSPRESAADAESKKLKSKIPVKAASFDQTLGKGDSTEQSRRPKSEADMGLSEWLLTGIDCSSAKSKSPASRLPVPIEQTQSAPSQLPPEDPQDPESTQQEHDHGSFDIEGENRHLAAIRPSSVGEDVFETRPNWEDCVETQMQRISDSSSPDQSKVDWHDDADRKEETLAIIADLLGFSWTELAKELEFSEDEVQQVRSENPNSLQEQSNALLQRWVEREGKHANEDCLIKRLTKINRMDIVHLIETQMNKSVQEQTSRTYAEIERTLDHSEALSSVQEDVDSPRLVRRVDVSSQRHPPAVSEEDLSVASLLDIPSWAETVGHTHSESIHGDMLEELDITQDGFANPWAVQEVRAESADRARREEQLSHPNHAQCDLSDHVDTCLSPSPPISNKGSEHQHPPSKRNKNFFSFSQTSIDQFSNELSAEEPTNEREHTEPDLQDLEESPLDSLSPVCEKSDIEGNEKSLSELVQSPLSESAGGADVLQSSSIRNEEGSESDWASGQNRLTSLPVPMLKEGSPEDWMPPQLGLEISQVTLDTLRTPIESDYVLVDQDEVPADPMSLDSATSGQSHMVVKQEGIDCSVSVDSTSLKSSCYPEDTMGRQDLSAELDEVSRNPGTQKDKLVTIPNQSNDFQVQEDGGSPHVEQILHQSEDLCDEHDSEVFSAQEQRALQMPELQINGTSNKHADDDNLQLEAQSEMETMADSWVLKETTHESGPFSVSDVSPQTPETVRATQHFEYEEVLSEPGVFSTEQAIVIQSVQSSDLVVLTKDTDAARSLTKDTEAAKSKDPKRALSQSESPSQCSEKAWFARRLSDQTAALNCNAGQGLLQEPDPSETVGSGAEHANPTTIKPGNNDPESRDVPGYPAEDASSKIYVSSKASAGKPHIPQSVLQKPEDSDSETFFECKQTLSDHSEPEFTSAEDVDHEVRSDSCVGQLKPELRTQRLSPSSTFKKVDCGSIRSSESEDYEDAPIIQEEEDVEDRWKHITQTPQELHPQGGAKDDEGDDDDDDMWRDLGEELGALCESSDEDVLSTRVVRRRVIIQADEVPDVPLQPATEERYTDEQGNLVIKKVSRRVIHRCVSADGVEREEVRVEGHPAGPVTVGLTDSCSKVVKRTVVKSEGDQTEVTFCEQDMETEENGRGREVTQRVQTTVVQGERMEKHLGDPRLATDLPTARDDFTQALRYLGGFEKVQTPRVSEQQLKQPDGSVIRRARMKSRKCVKKTGVTDARGRTRVFVEHLNHRRHDDLQHHVHRFVQHYCGRAEEEEEERDDDE